MMLDSPTTSALTAYALREHIDAFQVVYTARDSVHVRWSLTSDSAAVGDGQQQQQQHQQQQQQLFQFQHQQKQQTTGFSLFYQAVGSSVQTKINNLQPTASELTIKELHENTYYDICIQQQLSNESFLPMPTRHCLRTVTATDSIAVALGTGFGAFLTLTLLTFLIYVAKWQHKRKMRKAHELLACDPAAAATTTHNGLLVAGAAADGTDDIIFTSLSEMRKASTTTLTRVTPERRGSGRRKGDMKRKSISERRRESTTGSVRRGTHDGGGGGGRRHLQSTASEDALDSSHVATHTTSYARKDSCGEPNSSHAQFDSSCIDIDDLPSTSTGIRHYDCYTPSW